MSRYTLETIVIVLVILWLLGWLVIPIAGSLIHLLLVIVLVVLFCASSKASVRWVSDLNDVSKCKNRPASRMR